MNYKTFSHASNIPLPELETVSRNDQRWYQLPSGRMVPSVTTVLGHFKKDSLNAWKKKVGEAEAGKITRQAGVRGTQHHALVEKYLQNTTPKELFVGITHVMRQAFHDLMPVLNKIDMIEYQESCLHSEQLGTAGRVDLIAEFDGIPSIIDFKTSLREKKPEWITDYKEQAAAYAKMYEGHTGRPLSQTVVIISVDQVDEPQVFIQSKSEIDQHYKNFKDKVRKFMGEHDQ